MTDIAISRVHFPVTMLGPGHRLGVWMQGCSIRCAGCISADTWAAGRGVTPLADLVARIEPWLAEADGVTISGGEPFDQPEALAALLGAIKARTAGDVLLYTGYPYAAVEARVDALAGLIDAIVSEPYEADRSQTLALRGSDNQILRCLTPLGKERLGPLIDAPVTDQALDVMFDDDGSVWFAGIPMREAWAALKQRLRAYGVTFATSDDASAKRGDGGGR